MPHLRSVSLAHVATDAFPFSVPAIRSLKEVDLSARVTFFVGENGSGKSTFLEGIALNADLPTVGSTGARDDATLAAQKALAKALRLTWTTRVRRGFFLRAEDFFGFTKQLSQMRAELIRDMARIDSEFEGRSDYAKRLAKGPMRASLGDMEQRYGMDLDANSHGQSFLKLFQSRFVPDGLYLLDEPEAPLSPQSQLALLAMLTDMVAQNAQFIVATHSPILLAYPGARIYSFDATPIRETAYDALEHVTLTREFLKSPDRFLRHL